jgi:hypothetical protein
VSRLQPSLVWRHLTLEVEICQRVPAMISIAKSRTRHPPVPLSKHTCTGLRYQYVYCTVEREDSARVSLLTREEAHFPNSGSPPFPFVRRGKEHEEDGWTWKGHGPARAGEMTGSMSWLANSPPQ